MSAIKIFVEGDGETLCFHEGDRLATISEFNSYDRSVGSIFEALQPGEVVELAEGQFRLDDDLDLTQH